MMKAERGISISTVEIKQIDGMRSRLEKAVAEGVRLGDLSKAAIIQSQMELSMMEIKHRLDPVNRLPLDLKELVEMSEAKLMRVEVGEGAVFGQTGNIVVERLARKMIESRNYTIAKKWTGIDLICLSVCDLGFGKKQVGDFYFWEICRQAGKKGLGLCPAEVGPALRLKYRDQPVGENVYVAMVPIRADDDEPKFVFSLRADNSKLMLGASICHSKRDRYKRSWSYTDKFIFRLP